MFTHISEHELRLLRELKYHGDQPTLPSNHRIRLEMLGLASDGPRGLRLTEKGERLACRAVLPSWITLSSDMSDLASWKEPEEASDVEEESSATSALVLADEPVGAPSPPESRPQSLTSSLVAPELRHRY